MQSLSRLSETDMGAIASTSNTPLEFFFPAAMLAGSDDSRRISSPDEIADAKEKAAHNVMHKTEKCIMRFIDFPLFLRI